MLILGLVLVLVVIQIGIVRADIIDPGMKYISVNNYIDNIGEFEDYEFVSVGFLGQMCPPQEIGEDGLVQRYYKFCSVEVYAFEKGKYDELKVLELFSNDERENNLAAREYFESEGIKVLEGLRTSDYVKITDPKGDVINHFNVSLSEVKKDPNNQEIGWSLLLYLLVGVYVIALLIIVFIFYRRRNRNA